MKKVSLTNRFIKFSVAAGIGLVLDLGVLFSLVEFLGLHYLFSAFVAFIFSATSEYGIDKSWGFKDTKTKIGKSYISFILIAIFTIIIILISLWVLVDIFQIHYLVSRIIIAIFVGILNFVLNYRITFELGKRTKTS